MNKDLIFDILITKHHVITDPNILFTLLPQRKSEFYNFELFIRETNRVTDKNTLGIKIIYRETDREVYIYRNFEKIDNIVANVAAIFYAVYFIFKIFIYFFRKGNLSLNLMNKLYKFKHEDDTNVDFEAFNSIMVVDSMINKKSKIKD